MFIGQQIRILEWFLKDHVFIVFFYQINAALVTKDDFFQKH